MSEDVAKVKFEGEVHTFGLPDGDENEGQRQYIVVTLPFEIARQVTKVFRYTAGGRGGEQRVQNPKHVSKLKNEVQNGRFTPTVLNLGLRRAHAEELKNDGKHASLTVTSDNPLPIVDGGHRMAALEQLYNDELFRDKVKDQPLTFIVYLDGHTRTDFLNLQEGRRVDRSHQLSLKIEQGMMPAAVQENWEFAQKTARKLSTDESSPFHKLISLDSRRGDLQMGFNSLVGSDMAFSLRGLAKVAAKHEKPVDWAVRQVLDTYHAIKSHASSLMSETSLLATPRDGGTKGGATLLIGIATMLAYRVGATGKEAATEEELKKMVKSAKAVFNLEREGNLSNPHKRSLMGQFASNYFSDSAFNQVQQHEGIPVTLLQLLGTSGFGVDKLPKAPKSGGQRGRRKKGVEETTAV